MKIKRDIFQAVANPFVSVIAPIFVSSMNTVQATKGSLFS